MRRHIPHIIAILVLGVGVMDIISAILPATLDRWKIIQDILPLGVIRTTRTLSLIGGIFLLYLGRALWNQKKRAWTLATLTLVVTLFFHLSKGLDIEETIISLIIIFILWYFRSLYFVESHRTKYISAILRSLIILIVLFVYTLGGYTLLKSSFFGTENIRSLRSEYIYDATGIGTDQLLPANRFAHWFENSISLFSVIAVLAAIAALFEPAFEKSLSTEEEKKQLLNLIGVKGEESSYFALMDDKSLWFDESRSSAIAYKKIGKYALILGEPIGENDLVGTSWQFQEKMIKLGGDTIWYNMRGTDLASKLGMIPVKIGEDAILSTMLFSLSGPALKDVRNAVSHTSKLGLNYVWYRMSEIPWGDLKLINDIYENWTRNKKIPPLTFSLGFYPFPVITEGLVLLVKDNSGLLLGVLSFFPYHQRKSYELDLMMRAKSTPSGVIESAIVHAVDYFKAIDVTELNLGMAPLSNIEFMGSNKLMSSIRNLLMSQFNKFYQYKSLAEFKKKFDPIWRPKYIYLKTNVMLPQALSVIASAHRK